MVPKHGSLPDHYGECEFLVTTGDIDWWFGPSIYDDRRAGLFYLKSNITAITYIGPENMIHGGKRVPKLFRAIAYSVAKDRGLL